MSVTVGGVVSGAWTMTTVRASSLVFPLKSVARANTLNDEPTDASAGIAWWASAGGSGLLPTWTPLTRKMTAATPTLSVALADSRMVSPGAACAGAFRVTTGFSVSGAAEIVTVASAFAVLPLVSRAVAVNRIVAPTGATAGTEITRRYGGLVTRNGSAPSTSNVTDSTAALSVACAVIVTWLPGSASFGPSKLTTGGVRSSMLAVVVAVFVPPRPSDTVNATVNFPDVLYAWLVVPSVAVVPSPKSQAKLRVSLSGSPEPAPLNEMACPPSPPYGPPGGAPRGPFTT